MILIEKLHNYLNKGEEVPMEELAFRLPEEQIVDGHIYGKYIMDGKFAFIGKVIMNCPEWLNLSGFQVIMDKAFKRNSFTVSLMSILMPEFRYFDMNSRRQFVLDLHRQIGYDMEEKSLYKDMGYTRMRKQIRESFINGLDIDGDKSLMQVLVDYFSLTVYVIRKSENCSFVEKRDVERISYVPSVWRKTERNEDFWKKNLVCLLMEQEGKYYPLVMRDKGGLLNWQDGMMEGMVEELERDMSRDVKRVVMKKKEEENVVEKIEKVKMKRGDKEKKEEGDEKEEKEEKEKKKDEELIGRVKEMVGEIKMRKKITLAEIQEIAVGRGIQLMKKSERTGKMLKKTIEELRVEIEEKGE